MLQYPQKYKVYGDFARQAAEAQINKYQLKHNTTKLLPSSYSHISIDSKSKYPTIGDLINSSISWDSKVLEGKNLGNSKLGHPSGEKSGDQAGGPEQKITNKEIQPAPLKPPKLAPIGSCVSHGLKEIPLADFGETSVKEDKKPEENGYLITVFYTKRPPNYGVHTYKTRGLSDLFADLAALKEQ